MSEKTPTLQQWKTLVQLMRRIFAIAPWDWLGEDSPFCVQNPATGEIGMVSVMGELGEHFAIALYPGEDEIQKILYFMEFADPNDEEYFESLLEIRQLQASFEDREFLDSEDRKLLKRMAFTFRGRNAWPMFRTYRPGFVPWFIDMEEAVFLQAALEQTVEIAQRTKHDMDILYPPEENCLLLRRPVRNGNRLEWRDDLWHLPECPPDHIEYFTDRIGLEKLKKLPRKPALFEIDLMKSTGPVRENDERPYFPYVLILIDADHGIIVKFVMIPPLPDFETMWKKMPSLIAGALIEIGYQPETIVVESERLHDALKHLSAHLETSVRPVKTLLIAPDVRAGFKEYTDKNSSQPGFLIKAISQSEISQP